MFNINALQRIRLLWTTDLPEVYSYTIIWLVGENISKYAICTDAIWGITGQFSFTNKETMTWLMRIMWQIPPATEPNVVVLRLSNWVADIPEYMLDFFCSVKYSLLDFGTIVKFEGNILYRSHTNHKSWRGFNKKVLS